MRKVLKMKPVLCYCVFICTRCWNVDKLECILFENF